MVAFKWLGCCQRLVDRWEVLAQVFDDIAKRLPRAAPPPPVTGGITLDAPPQVAKKSACC